MVQEAGKTLLAQRLIAEDGGAVCQIEAPGLRAYWYADAAITVFFTQIRGQPDSLLTEHKRHVAGKIRLDIAARRLGGGEPDIAIAMLLAGANFFGLATVGKVFNVIGLVCLVIATVLTIWSGAGYIVKNRKVLSAPVEKKSEKTQEENKEESGGESV